jgi:2'-5' RNA ligase
MNKKTETTNQLCKEFEEVTRPVIEWLNANYHPHVTVVIESTSAMLSEGAIAYTTSDYVRD